MRTLLHLFQNRYKQDTIRGLASGYEIKGRSFFEGFVCLFLLEVCVHSIFVSELNQTQSTSFSLAQKF